VVIGLLVLLPLQVLGGVGAGDVKILAVLGLQLGGKALLPIWVIASLLAGVHAVFLLAWRRMGKRLTALYVALECLSASCAWRRVLMARQGREGLPYAAYMALGALLTVSMPQLAHW
jgi:prepilin peptidase CpaA